MIMGKILIRLMFLFLFPLSLLFSFDRGKHSLALEYTPVFLPLAFKGGGFGLGYDYRINNTLALGGTGVLSVIPVNTGGHITLAGVKAAVQIYPFHGRAEGFLSRTGMGLLYMGAQGENHFGGLESHFILYYVQEALGWRFLIGSGKVQFFCQPEVDFIFVFPGMTGSGYKDNLVWSSTGWYLAALYPNLVLGINF